MNQDLITKADGTSYDRLNVTSFIFDELNEIGSRDKIQSITDLYDAEERLAKQFSDQITETDICTDNLHSKIIFENSHLYHADIHNLWGMVQLQNLNDRLDVPVNLILIIDANKTNIDKLSYIKNFITYVLSELIETDTLSIILKYLTSTKVIVNNQQCDRLGKIKIESTFESITIDKSNGLDFKMTQSKITEYLAKGLVSAIDLSNLANDSNTQKAVILFTDLDTVSNNTINEFIKIKIPAGIDFAVFAYGSHSSSGLCELAAKKNSTYHYIPTQSDISVVFDNYLDHVTRISFTQLKIKFEGLDGARLIKVITPNPIAEVKLSKNYIVHINNLSSASPKTILFKLSIKSLKESQIHKLLNIDITGINLSGSKIKQNLSLTALRSRSREKDALSVELDARLNEYVAMMAILDIIKLNHWQFTLQARSKLQELIMQIIKSVSHSKCAKMIYYLTKIMGTTPNPTTLQNDCGISTNSFTDQNQQSMNLINYFFGIVISERSEMFGHLEQLVDQL